MRNVPEQVNQTFIGLIIGLISLYYFINLKIPSVLKIILICLLTTYSFYMAVLSCIQMYKNTKRYWKKEKIIK
jgi:hypothetical protein